MVAVMLETAAVFHMSKLSVFTLLGKLRSLIRGHEGFPEMKQPLHPTPMGVNKY